MNLTAVISKGEGIFVGEIMEIPGVFSQGKTVDETKANLLKVLNLWLEHARDDLKSENLNLVYIESLEIN